MHSACCGAKGARVRLLLTSRAHCAAGGQRYLDLDVWAAQPISAFLAAAAPFVPTAHRSAAAASASLGAANNAGASSNGGSGGAQPTWLVLFEDCAAHAVGWCVRKGLERL